MGARGESERALQDPGERGREPCPSWHLAEDLDLETGGPLRQGGPWVRPLAAQERGACAPLTF